MDKGLAVGTAASIAGLRGFCQLFGRVGVIAAIARSEAAYALRVSYLAAAVAFFFAETKMASAISTMKRQF